MSEIPRNLGMRSTKTVNSMTRILVQEVDRLVVLGVASVGPNDLDKQRPKEERQEGHHDPVVLHYR